MAATPGEQATPFRLGSTAPNFTAETTKGTIDFYKYAGNAWTILFCYPVDFAPVATTELILLAKLQPEFDKFNVKLLALSTGDSLERHLAWEKDIEEISGAPLEFPIIADKDRTISHLYNVVDDGDLEDSSTGDSTGFAFKTRSAFIISPQKKFKLIFNYPASVGMNTVELIRVLHCLETVEAAKGLRTPGNWIPGCDLVIHPDITDEQAQVKFPNYQSVKPYLRFVETPTQTVEAEHLLFRKGHLASHSIVAQDGLLSGALNDEEHHAIVS
ncbi:thioredoxin-like protein [Lojkania enalia]|uniref:Thioredoxin-like protein n=1 Tax=Lojkania enalia TaxID=147567 RepID=A0A9P4KGU9_9PLEO|nr:thioredoxin-like protein [Didymosphaeria enalia]